MFTLYRLAFAPAKPSRELRPSLRVERIAVGLACVAGAHYFQAPATQATVA